MASRARPPTNLFCLTCTAAMLRCFHSSCTPAHAQAAGMGSIATRCPLRVATARCVPHHPHHPGSDPRRLSRLAFPVATLKNEKIGKVDAAKRSMFEEKVDAVQSVKDIEERWRHLTQRERDDFLGHALDNHKKADFTKEQMRGARRELRSKNARHVELERQRKEGDKDIIEERKEREEVAKRALRDGVYSARSISPDKSRQVAKAASRSTSKSPTKRRAQEKALATLADLGVPLPPGSPPSPYKLP